MKNETDLRNADTGAHYIHRDVSWLSFNERVLQEAEDQRNPLYERMKFLAIYSKNLGEFFHVRMPYHLNLIRINKSTRKQLTYSPKRLVKQLIQIVNEQQLHFTHIVTSQILPELESHGIFIKSVAHLTEDQVTFIDEYFNDTVRIHVDPLLMRGRSVLPFLKDASLYLGVMMTDKNHRQETTNGEYGLVRIPSDVLPRFIVLPSTSGRHEVMMLDDVVRYGLPYLFPGFHVNEAYSFKMTRDAELYIDSNISGEIKDMIKKSLHKRKVGVPARFVYDRDCPEGLLTFLTDTFDLSKYDKIEEGRYQNFHDFFSFPDFGKKELQYQELRPIQYPPLELASDPLQSIEREDHLLHPPYHSFESVVRFFEHSAQKPSVSEIMITQYRIGDNSRILNALIRAAQCGKKVTVFLEVQARFDEQANLAWGEKLEAAGVKVVYSIPGVKVHCKIGMVTTTHQGRSRRYAVLSTGNFHECNSKIYSDMCLFTADQRICDEVYQVFNHLVSMPDESPSFQHLMVGKVNLRDTLVQMIDGEIENAQNNLPARIVLKMNNLEDEEIIQKLYDASKANVKIDLIIRGICCLIPGLPGISENITAVSILDRYLEHDRVYYFHANGAQKLYLSSADWMTRNLSRRVEVAFPIYDKKVANYILNVLDIQLRDNVKARMIDDQGSNTYKVNNQEAVRSQYQIYRLLHNGQSSASVSLTAPSRIGKAAAI